MPLTESESGKAIRTVFRAANVLDARKPNPSRALEILSPYLGLEPIEGVPAEKSDNLLHLICSIAGDAHREANEYALAADWYRRASDFRRDGGYINFYVDTVIEHRLDSHYEHALACLRDSKEAWSNTPLPLRAIGHVCSFVRRLKRPWSFKPYRELQHRAKEFDSMLVSRIEEMKQADPPID
jgi:tetratricopeptide (TPR) repeat protein